MQRFFIVTIWSGGKPGKRWKTLEEPQVLPQGTGVQFCDLDTKLAVKVIGNISVEQYEQEVHEFEPEATPAPKKGALRH